MTRRFLVTGGAGFIGAALVRRLVSNGHSVRVLDDISRGQAGRLADISDQIDFRRADIRDSATVIEAAEQVDTIVHLAAVNGTEFFYSKPQRVLDVGIRGMLSVLDACEHHDIKRLFVASSSEVYQTPPKIPTTESVPLSVPDPLNPRYSYGGSKIASELLAINFGRTRFEQVVIFRPHNVYGPDMGWEHVIPQLAMRAAQAVQSTPRGPVGMEIQGDGRQTRAFVYIDDFVDGLILTMEKGEHLQIYNIGTDEEVRIADLATQIVGCFGRTADIRFTDAPAGGTQRRCPDIAKLKNLGFVPKVPLSAGLGDVVTWYAAAAKDRPQHNNFSRN